MPRRPHLQHHLQYHLTRHGPQICRASASAPTLYRSLRIFRLQDHRAREYRLHRRLLRGRQPHGHPQDTVPSRLAPCCSCSGRRAPIQACRSCRSFAASRCAIAPSATSIRKIAAPSVAPLTVSPRTPQLHSTGRASQRQRRSTRLQHHRARRHHQSRELQIHRGSLHPPAEFLIELHRLAKSTTKYLRTQLQEINPRRVYPA